MPTIRRMLAVSTMGVMLAWTLPAFAQRAGDGRGPPPGRPPGNSGERPRRSMPEFDPGAAGAVAAVIAGGTVLLARRRKR